MAAWAVVWCGCMDLGILEGSVEGSSWGLFPLKNLPTRRHSLGRPHCALDVENPSILVSANRRLEEEY